MNSEENRLRTFRNWPSNAGVDPRKIAKAGFYYMGQGVEVQCFSCGGRISDWNYEDRGVAVIRRHKMLDARCPFIRDPHAAGNVPISSSVARSTSESSRASESESSRVSESSPDSTRVGGESPDSSSNRRVRAGLSLSGCRVSCSNSVPPCSHRELFQSESARLESFTRWPLSYISPNQLAKAGFFYTGHSDKVECYYCEGTVEGWEEGDCPVEEHRRHYPTCPFLCSMSHGIHIRNSTHHDASTPFKGEYEELNCLGVHKHRIPRSPKYSTFETRLRSFKNWPPSIPQTPQQLADAGFYFTGRGDQVRCFHCDGGLRLWESGDDPWDEHARWFSDCGFLFLVRGQQFIDQTLNSLRCIPSAMKVEGRGVKRKQETKVRTVTDEELQAAMHSPQALAALEVGLEVYRVKLALKERLESVGQGFSRSEDLITAAFALQVQEDSDQEESWSVSSLAALLLTLRGTPPNSPAVLGKNRVSPRRDHLTRQSSSTSPRPSPSRDFIRTTPPRSSPHSSSSSCSGRKSESPVLERKRPQADQQNSSSGEKCMAGDVEEELRRLREGRQCKVCMDREVGVVLLPCGHLVTCALCTHSLVDCPLCRQLIQATVRTFLS